MNAALLLSGGTGARMGLDVPKQYLRVGEFMIVTQALRRLGSHPRIDKLQVVADPAWREEIRADWERCLESPGNAVDKPQQTLLLGFSDPGENRQLSILQGLRDLAVSMKQDVDGQEAVVLIHDAARPMLSAGTITACLDACTEHDGAMPVLPMKDTVYYSKSGERVDSLLARETIYAGQAPEAFKLDKYLAANEALLPDKILSIRGSTEPAVMAGMDVAMIPGDEANFKITTRADLERYERVING